MEAVGPEPVSDWPETGRGAAGLFDAGGGGGILGEVRRSAAAGGCGGGIGAAFSISLAV